MPHLPSAQIISLGQQRPQIAADAFIAPGAMIVGDVHIGAGASVWFNCTLRADVAPINVGSGANIQDGSVVHADPGYPTYIGEDVLIGHMAIVHGCTIGQGGFVGMGAIVLTGAVIESDAMLAAGALLTGGKTVGTRQLWAGRPAKYLRALTDAELAEMQDGVAHYRRNAVHYRSAMSV